MKLESVHDAAFREYGQILEGYDFSQLLDALKNTGKPNDLVYVPSEKSLETTKVFEELEQRYYGGMSIQMGYCNGYNVKLNGLEYHRDSEVNIAANDIIVLLAKLTEINPDNLTLDTSHVRAFLLPAGVAVGYYATTLHYAPCATGPEGFRVALALTRGTNTVGPNFVPRNKEEKLLAAKNKWLLVHPEAAEAGQHVGLVGENIDVTPLWKK
ncbi:MAG: DUF4867 family protein [Synergistaceae bacterium]|jgi:hypothetical protein|nr:DUF4867 family protein [Synergistaceae bacterium]